MCLFVASDHRKITGKFYYYRPYNEAISLAVVVEKTIFGEKSQKNP